MNYVPPEPPETASVEPQIVNIIGSNPNYIPSNAHDSGLREGPAPPAITGLIADGFRHYDKLLIQVHTLEATLERLTGQSTPGYEDNNEGVRGPSTFGDLTTLMDNLLSISIHLDEVNRRLLELF